MTGDVRTGKLVGVAFEGGEEIPEEMAREMALLGAVISTRAATKIGDILNLAGNPAVITQEITREEFLERATRSGLGSDRFQLVPAQYAYYAISMD